MISRDERNTILNYYADLKKHCEDSDKKGGCPQCDLRLFCHTPACALNDEMINMVIDFAYEHSHTDDHNHLDRCSGLFQWPCPGDMDMTTALGSSVL